MENSKTQKEFDLLNYNRVGRNASEYRYRRFRTRELCIFVILIINKVVVG